MKTIFAFLLMSFLSLPALAEDGHGEAEDASERFGPGKAIEAFDKEQGFKLSEKAAKSLGIKYLSLQGSGPWSVPKEAVVHIKQSSGLYRKYDGWISLVLVKVIKDSGTALLIRSEDLEAGDEVAVTGSQFLRMTDADLNSGTVDSCAH